MSNYTFGILRNELPDSAVCWINACEKFSVGYDVIDLTTGGWLTQATTKPYDCFLLCPSGRVAHFKKLYDERTYILNKILGKNIYPSYTELALHENKNLMAYWLKANGIPHIDTHIFYHHEEALSYVRSAPLPMVAKTSIGASGEGVAFLKTKESAIKYVNNAFSKGIRRKAGPALRQGDLLKRALHRSVNIKGTIDKLRGYYATFSDIQKGSVLFQTFIPHEFEWRGVRIGTSYFAHKKVKAGEMCSGSKGIDYVTPPVPFLDFVRHICDKGNFLSMAVDVLEDPNHGYLVNELQTVFGHVQEYILEVDGKRGRYTFDGSQWIFEEGNFNTNLSFDLRLEHVLSLLNENKL
jgi:hypothetical protein